MQSKGKQFIITSQEQYKKISNAWSLLRNSWRRQYTTDNSVERPCKELPLSDKVSIGITGALFHQKGDDKCTNISRPCKENS